MADTNIEVRIANRTYPLTIAESEVEKLQVAAQLINKNIDKLKGDYVVTDYVDLLAMTALELAMEPGTAEKDKESIVNQNLDMELEAIGKSIDLCLNAGESS